jgi:hypothetical protein
MSCRTRHFSWIVLPYDATFATAGAALRTSVRYPMPPTCARRSRSRSHVPTCTTSTGLALRAQLDARLEDAAVRLGVEVLGLQELEHLVERAGSIITR